MKNQAGFTIIELVIVMLIIGLMLSIGLPKLRNSFSTEIKSFVVRLNSLTEQAAQQAQKHNIVYKVIFDFITKKVSMVPIINRQEYLKKDINIPESITIDDFLIDNKSQFIIGGGTKKSAYFLINPMGITQNVKIILIDNNLQKKNSSFGIYNIVLNPFTSHFSYE